MTGVACLFVVWPARLWLRLFTPIFLWSPNPSPSSLFHQAIGLVERATVVSEDMAAAGVDNVHLLEAMESSLVGRVIPPLMDALLPITEAFELAFASRVASPTQRLFQALDRLHAVSPSARETVDAGDFLTGSVMQKEWVEETPHQYENNMRDDRKISMPGAAELTLHFDPQCRTENGCDWLGIYTGPNQSGTLLRKLTGPSVNWPKAPFKVWLCARARCVCARACVF